MSEIYQAGEAKKRPGVYGRYTTPTKKNIAEALTGVFAIPVKADFGPVGTVTVHTNKESVEELYGAGGTVKGAFHLFEGGASKVYLYRLGTDGTAGEVKLEDTEGKEQVHLTTKYVTNLQFNVTLSRKSSDSTKKEFAVYQETTLKEKLEFEAGENADEAANLIEAIQSNSSIFEAKRAEDQTAGICQLSDVNQKQITVGTNPNPEKEDYDKALEAFEPYKWNVLVLDITYKESRDFIKTAMDRMKEAGSIGICVVGDSADTDFETRLEYAKELNSEYFVYTGSGYVDTEGNKIDGYEAVAMQAAVIGSTPSNQSVVHAVLPNAVDLVEVFKREDYIRAIDAGMVLLSSNEEGQVWFDSGVTTLTNLKENQDPGWKKIRRTMTRYEMWDRIDKAVAPLIGKVHCNSDGVANIIKVAKDVLDDMVKENKLKDGADFFEDVEHPLETDTAYFVIAASDVDSLEKIYLNYQFSFAAE